MANRLLEFKQLPAIQGRERCYTRKSRPAVANRLRAARESAGLSRTELARLSGLTVWRLRSIEAGLLLFLEPHEYRALATSLGRSPRWLAGLGV